MRGKERGSIVRREREGLGGGRRTLCGSCEPHESQTPEVSTHYYLPEDI
jgi:hypothetical protein